MDLDPQTQVVMLKENVLAKFMSMGTSAINVLLVCLDFLTVKIVHVMQKALLMKHVKMTVENVTVKITLLVTNVVNVLANIMDSLTAKVCTMLIPSFLSAR